MNSNGKRDVEENFISVGQSDKKPKNPDPSRRTIAKGLVCSRHKCVEGTIKNGNVVTFSLKPNGNSYYKECDECRKHTAEKNPKTNPKTNLKVSLPNLQPTFSIEIDGFVGWFWTLISYIIPFIIIANNFCRLWLLMRSTK
jgi:hypothetical protein